LVPKSAHFPSFSLLTRIIHDREQFVYEWLKEILEDRRFEKTDGLSEERAKKLFLRKF
jgi:hypothetical protein